MQWEKNRARRTPYCSVLSSPHCLTLSITPERQYRMFVAPMYKPLTVLRHLLQEVMQRKNTSLLKFLRYFIVREGRFTLTWHRWLIVLIPFPRWIILSGKTAKHYQLWFRQPSWDESGCRNTSSFREAGNLPMIKGRSLQNTQEIRLPVCLQKSVHHQGQTDLAVFCFVFFFPTRLY